MHWLGAILPRNLQLGLCWERVKGQSRLSFGYFEIAFPWKTALECVHKTPVYFFSYKCVCMCVYLTFYLCGILDLTFFE